MNTPVIQSKKTRTKFNKAFLFAPYYLENSRLKQPIPVAHIEREG
jgi:hypothetical protein